MKKNQQTRRQFKRKRANVSASSRNSPRFGYDRSHALIERKIIPASIELLARELQLPQNSDLRERSIKGNSFEECLAILAADLDIALDGEYSPTDISNICEILVKRMRDRKDGVNQATPHLSDSRLKNAELIERGETISLEEVGRAIGTIAPGVSESAGPYTVCDSCKTSFECCLERDCRLGKPAAQLGRTGERLAQDPESLNKALEVLRASLKS